MAVTQLKDGRWICYYRVKDGQDKGKLKKEYFGRGPEAENKAKERNEALGLLKRRPAKRAGPAFVDLAEAYITSKDFNPNSYDLLELRLQKIILPLLGRKRAFKLTHQDLQKYVDTRRKTVAKHGKGFIQDSTIRREITDIKAIMNWAANRQPPLIPHNPVHNFKPPAEKNAVILPPTQEETNRIMENAAPHLLRAILLSYYLGLRPGAVELLTLEWSSVNWENMSILVKSAEKGGAPKRIVPIHEGLAATLKFWFDEDKGSGPIIHYHGKAINSLKTAWKGALAGAKVKRRLRPYDLRHGMITTALERGADIKALAEVVGSSPETLRKHYQHVSTELRRRTISKIPEIPIPKSNSKRKKRAKP